MAKPIFKNLKDVTVPNAEKISGYPIGSLMNRGANCDNKDLNTFTEFGVYLCTSTTNASLANHFPEVSSGLLIVFPSAGNRVAQIYITHTKNRWYFRSSTATSNSEPFTPWGLLDFESKAASLSLEDLKGVLSDEQYQAVSAKVQNRLAKAQSEIISSFEQEQLNSNNMQTSDLQKNTQMGGGD